jgi:hypothetical protein
MLDTGGATNKVAAREHESFTAVTPQLNLSVKDEEALLMLVMQVVIEHITRAQRNYAECRVLMLG